MKIIGKKLVYKGEYLKVIQKEYLTKTKKRGNWDYIERKGAVIIFALTKEKEVILEKIFRIPLGSFSLELPGGMLDKKGESACQAAKRELLEETGYLAKKLTPVFQWPLEPSLVPDEAILFFAPDVEFKEKTDGEDSEEIEVLKVPLEKLEEFLLESKKDMTVDLKIFGALSILQNKKFV